jgi:hypothetical protein
MTVPTGDVPGRIFMSYRREDTDYPAYRKDLRQIAASISAQIISP